jgi:hypothetical protein
MAIFAVRRMDVRFEQRVNIKFCVKLGKTATSHVLPWSLSLEFFLFPRLKKRLKGRRHENIEAKRLRRWSSQAFRKRHSPAAFRTCRNVGNRYWLQRELLLLLLFFTDSLSELYGQSMYMNLLFCVCPSFNKFPEITVKCNRANYFNANQHTRVRAQTHTHA